MKNCEALVQGVVSLSAQLLLLPAPTRSGDASDAVRVGEVSTRALVLGRSPGSDLVFADDHVSWQHATIWFENGVLWVRDLGSRNGCLLNGEALSSARVLADGDRLSIAPAITLAVRFRGTRPLLAPHALVVEDLATAVRYPLRSDRFRFGPGADVDAGGDLPSNAVVLLTGPEDLWLGVDGEDRPLQLDEVFEVGGRRYAVRQADIEHSPTFEAAPSPTSARCELDARLAGPGGPEAVVTDARDRRTLRIEGENRAVLLYVLGRKSAADVRSGVPAAECGWLSDEEAATAIWGRTGRDENALHVLVHRLRKQLAEAGFDPWFIEKRRRCVRARFGRVVLDAEPGRAG